MPSPKKEGKFCGSSGKPLSSDILYYGCIDVKTFRDFYTTMWYLNSSLKPVLIVLGSGKQDDKLNLWLPKKHKTIFKQFK